MSEAPRQAFAYARVSTEDQAEEGLGIAAQFDGARAADADPFHLASIAAVVHALTARDGIEVPAWVHQYRAEPERISGGERLKVQTAALPGQPSWSRPITSVSVPARCSRLGWCQWPCNTRRGPVRSTTSRSSRRTSSAAASIWAGGR